VERIGPASRGLPVEALGLATMTTALGVCDRLLEATVEPTGFEPIPVARDRRIPEAEVNADLLIRSNRRLHLNDYRQA
jgi:hypothetical protein